MDRMPTKQEFKDALKLSWSVPVVGMKLGNEKSPFPGLTRIGKLIEDYAIFEEDQVTKLFI